MTSDERWLAANWPFVRASLPAMPARVVEIGCGPLGGFVPMMQAAGYQATGVDPEAPRGSSYRQVEFERYAVPGQLDAIVACTSLHHVADLAAVLDLVAGALVPGGRAVIVEWARERFDEATARWCFARLPEPDDDPGWLAPAAGRMARVRPALGCLPGVLGARGRPARRTGHPGRARCPVRLPGCRLRAVLLR